MINILMKSFKLRNKKKSEFYSDIDIIEIYIEYV